MDINRKILDQDFLKIYSQFKLDLPRLTLYINNDICNETYKNVSKFLFDNLKSTEAKFCIYFLTQNSLAEFYINEVNKLKESTVHLTDDGDFIVNLDTKLKTIEVSKKFRKFYLENEMDDFEIDFGKLNLSYDISESLLCHYWEYDFESEIRPIIIEK